MNQTPNLQLFTDWIKNDILSAESSQFVDKVKSKADKLGITPIELMGFAKLSLNKTKDPNRLDLLNQLITKAREAKLIKEVEATIEEPPLDTTEPASDLNLEPKEKEAEPLDNSVDEMTNKFPQLKETLVDLLTHEYKTFIKDIYWAAPRPTTFKIILVNEQYFYLIWYKLTFIAQVSGKKFYLLNLNEEQRAVKAIAELLRLGNTNTSSPQNPSLKTDKKEKTPLPFEPEPEEINNSEPGSEENLG